MPRPDFLQYPVRTKRIRAALLLLPLLSVLSAQEKSPRAPDLRAALTRHLDLAYTMPYHRTAEEWLARKEALRRQILVSAGIWPPPPRGSLNANIFDRSQDAGDSGNPARRRLPDGPRHQRPCASLGRRGPVRLPGGMGPRSLGLPRQAGPGPRCPGSVGGSLTPGVAAALTAGAPEIESLPTDISDRRRVGRGAGRSYS